MIISLSRSACLSNKYLQLVIGKKDTSNLESFQHGQEVKKKEEFRLQLLSKNRFKKGRVTISESN